MTRKPAVKGSTPEERRKAREARREFNRAQFFRDAAQSASSGRERLVAACRAAQSVGAHLTERGRYLLAQEIGLAVDRVNVPENRKEVR